MTWKRLRNRALVLIHCIHYDLWRKAALLLTAGVKLAYLLRSTGKMHLVFLTWVKLYYFHLRLFCLVLALFIVSSIHLPQTTSR